MNNEQIHNVALYLRLSKEDELVGQSESIQNQRDFITRYVLEQGWNIVDIYIEACEIIEPQSLTQDSHSMSQMGVVKLLYY